MTPGPFRFGWVSHASSAERLIGVDLLDCAAEFLETQIDHRLTGGAKAWAGSQLAQVCLFDRQPDKVLQALDSGYLLGLAVDLTGEHHRVRAQALQTADRRGGGVGSCRWRRERDGTAPMSRDSLAPYQWAGGNLSTRTAGCGYAAGAPVDCSRERYGR